MDLAEYGAAQIHGFEESAAFKSNEDKTILGRLF